MIISATAVVGDPTTSDTTTIKKHENHLKRFKKHSQHHAPLKIVFKTHLPYVSYVFLSEVNENPPIVFKLKTN